MERQPLPWAIPQALPCFSATEVPIFQDAISFLLQGAAALAAHLKQGLGIDDAW